MPMWNPDQVVAAYYWLCYLLPSPWMELGFFVGLALGFIARRPFWTILLFAVLPIVVALPTCALLFQFRNRWPLTDGFDDPRAPRWRGARVA